MDRKGPAQLVLKNAQPYSYFKRMRNPAKLGEYVKWRYTQLCARFRNAQPKFEGVTLDLVCSVVGGPVAMRSGAKVRNSNAKLIPEICASC